MQDQTKSVSVLFCCMGNICRSPTAEGVFRRQVVSAGLILAMDKNNLAQLGRVAPREHRDKPRLFMDYSATQAGSEVPDPYYGGPEGFEQVLDMTEDGCAGLLMAIKKKLGG